jgi:hypothetical protein
MSGTAIEAAGGTIVYIRNNAGTNQYSYNNSTWTTLSFPCTVENTNTGAGFLQVVFTTDITLSTTDSYFETLSDKIQFGSQSVNADGSLPIITISVSSYPGVFQNGTSATSGYNDIRIYNLTVDGTGYSTSLGGGWIGRGYFGNSASGCFIINCASKGSIGNNAGGILGYYSGTTGGSVSIIGCSSTGSIGQQAGGIVGSNCDNTTCEQCFSEGSIAQNGGGIFGQFTEGNCIVTKCYSTGVIGLGGGGIIGAGAKDGVSAEKCYSQGSIGQSAGGIFGAEAATTTATNCYTLGSLGTSAGGIFGNPFSTVGTRTESNCYKVQGSSWSDATANTNLTGTPSSPPDVGTTWASTGTNTAYELANFGPTPYQTQTISSNALVQSKSQTIEAGQSSASALATSTYTILEKTGGDTGSYDTITINATTGALSTTTATVAGAYTIYVRSTGSYYITTFVLTVTAYVAPATSTETATTCCKSTMDERDISYEWINDYRIGNRLIAEYRQNSNLKFNGYSEYVKYKMAQAARKT